MTALSVGTGLWQFNVMPSGLFWMPHGAGAGWTSDNNSTAVSGWHFGTWAYICPTSWQPPSSISAIENANVKLNSKKCALFQKEVKYLGHILWVQKGWPQIQQKSKLLKTWPRPSCIEDIKSFLGLASYYQWFVAGFADIAAPLHQYTHEEAPFTCPCIPWLEFIHDTDTGIGAVLSQSINGTERPVVLFSWALGRAQRNYCVTCRELLAII